MTVQRLTDENFSHATKGKWILFFSAPWAGPCNLVRGTFEKLAAKTNSIAFAEFSLDDNPNTPQRYGIRQVPTFISMTDGVPVMVKAGALPESSLEEMLKGLEND